MNIEGIADIEKSSEMIEHYKRSTDPWGNRSRKLYQKIFKEAAIQAFKFANKSFIKYYDIGAGGGNVIDTVIENKPDGVGLLVGGCDISKTAVDFLYENYSDKFYAFDVFDVEDYSYERDGVYANIYDADIVSFVDVMYYFDSKRYYKYTLDELWKTFKSGTIVVVADGIIPYQRRSYFKTKPDCEVLSEFTDYTAPVGQLNSLNKNRYLKVKIYRKK